MRCWCGCLSGAKCKWFTYGPADATATLSSSLASLKSRMALPFWYWLTQVVLEKKSLNDVVVAVQDCGTDLNSCSSWPDTNLCRKTMDAHYACFHSSFHWYQVILLDHRAHCVNNLPKVVTWHAVGGILTCCLFVINQHIDRWWVPRRLAVHRLRSWLHHQTLICPVHPLLWVCFLWLRSRGWSRLFWSVADIDIIQINRFLHDNRIYLLPVHWKPFWVFPLFLCGLTTGYASQHIWCLPQASINWEGCAQKGHPA